MKALFIIIFIFVFQSIASNNIKELRDLGISISYLDFGFTIPADRISKILEENLNQKSLNNAGFKIVFSDTKTYFRNGYLEISTRFTLKGQLYLLFLVDKIDTSASLNSKLFFSIKNWNLAVKVADLQLKHEDKVLEQMVSLASNDMGLDQLIEKEIERALNHLFSGKTLQVYAQEYINRFGRENGVQYIPAHSDLETLLTASGIQVKFHLGDLNTPRITLKPS